MTRSEIKLLAEEVENGQTIRFVCPVCLGGSSGERSLTITRRESMVLYNCYRSNCELRGGILGEARQVVRTTPVPKKPTVFTGSLMEIPDDLEEYLYNKIGWTRALHFQIGQPKYAVEDNRVAYPIFGPIGNRRGWVLRTYEDGVKPKVLTYRETVEPSTSWYLRHPGKPTLIVEDIPSAVRSAVYMNAMAMNGSGLGHEAVQEIAAHTKHVVWAFDQDATKEALRHHRKYGIYFESSKVLPLETDIKDLMEDDLCAVMDGLVTQ